MQLSCIKLYAYMRATKISKEIIAVLSQNKIPLSAMDILAQVRLVIPSVHKTTVYRRLASLRANHTLRETRLAGRAVAYELAHIPHHHHLICINCNKIKDVILKQDVTAEEKIIARRTHFKILNHALEFFGICDVCQTNPRAQSNICA